MTGGVNLGVLSRVDTKNVWMLRKGGSYSKLGDQKLSVWVPRKYCKEKKINFYLNLDFKEFILIILCYLIDLARLIYMSRFDQSNKYTDLGVI